jgi:hypothetical protein
MDIISWRQEISYHELINFATPFIKNNKKMKQALQASAHSA